MNTGTLLHLDILFLFTYLMLRLIEVVVVVVAVPAGVCHVVRGENGRLEKLVNLFVQKLVHYFRKPKKIV